MARLHSTFVLALSLFLLLESLCFAVPLPNLHEDDSNTDADWDLSASGRSLLGGYVCKPDRCEKEHPSPPCKKAVCKHGYCDTANKGGSCDIDGNKDECKVGECKSGECKVKLLTGTKCTVDSKSGNCDNGVCVVKCDPKHCPPPPQCYKAICSGNKCATKALSYGDCTLDGKPGKCEGGKCIAKCDPKHCGVAPQCNKYVCKKNKCVLKALSGGKCTLKNGKYGTCYDGYCKRKHHL